MQSEHRLAQNRVYQSRRRDRLLSNGLCIQCGKNKPSVGSTRCHRCLKYQAEKAIKRRFASKNSNNQQTRRQSKDS